MPLVLLFKANPYFLAGSSEMKENCLIIERLLEILQPNGKLIKMCNAYITNSRVEIEMRDEIMDELQNHNVFFKQDDMVNSFMGKLKFIRRNIKLHLAIQRAKKDEIMGNQILHFNP